MKAEVDFYRIASTQHVQLNQLQHQGESLRAAIYVNFAAELAESLRLADFPIAKLELPGNPAEITADFVRAPLYQLENYMSTLYARNIFEIDGDLKTNSVDLDETWKTRATTLVQHIRDIVQRAGLDPAENDRIMSRVNQLQSEIDRMRARIEAVTDVWLAITEAMGKGAKNLEPAANLIDRIGGAFSGLLRAEKDDRGVKQLPPPENLGLPAPTDSNTDSGARS